MSLLRHNRPQHPPLHSTASCIITLCMLILFTGGAVTHLPKTTSKWPQQHFLCCKEQSAQLWPPKSAVPLPVCVWGGVYWLVFFSKLLTDFAARGPLTIPGTRTWRRRRCVILLLTFQRQKKSHFVFHRPHSYHPPGAGREWKG